MGTKPAAASAMRGSSDSMRKVRDFASSCDFRRGAGANRATARNIKLNERPMPSALPQNSSGNERGPALAHGDLPHIVIANTNGETKERESIHVYAHG